MAITSFLSPLPILPRTRDTHPYPNHPLLLLLPPQQGPRSRRRHVRLRIRASLDDLLVSLPVLAPGIVTTAAAVVSGLVFSGTRAAGTSGGDDEPTTPSTAGEWILYTSPTPFNRAVLLRCPSVSFEDGGELLEGVDERLVTEERHYVNLSRGRIPAEKRNENSVSYQRVCITARDGGVLSVDWPEHLDLRKEHGLDTTIIIVPGTAQGSTDRAVKVLVLETLQNGYFPVVINPRGCAGSPVTTPRLFTAADSDDVYTAIQFVNTQRPWTTLMCIGWGYGANMLTKYLAEVGDFTPLTAAVCIDNPFNLDDVTGVFPSRVALEQKLLSGLIDILQSNKELFRGKNKQFNTQKALSATSLRDFDTAISMLSHGFDSVKRFYNHCNTEKLVNRIKIPVLYIQTDDGTVPLFSVPRSLISENPFTSLLLCSCLPSIDIKTEQYATLWSQHLAVEWLSAVEFALLKGRHPLLKDVDITLNTARSLRLFGDTTPQLSEFHDVCRGFDKSANNSPTTGFQADSIISLEFASQDKVNGHLKQMDTKDPGAKFADVDQQGDTSVDNEASQVLKTAGVVLNMLDVSMPGTLNDDQKKKVLTAVEQGETLIKALQGAVPEDVRGKLTSAVSEIMSAPQTNLSPKALRGIGLINAKPATEKQNQDTIKVVPTEERLSKDDNAPEVSRTGTHPTEGDPNGLSAASENNDVDVRDSSKGTSSSVAEDVEVVPATVNDHALSGFGADQKSVLNVETPPLSEPSSVPGNELKKTDPTEEASPTTEQSSLVQQHSVETGGNEVKKNNETSETLRPEQSPTSSKPPPISMTQAFDALTGLDDSTQMAVNSVFGVLENMIDELEKRIDGQSDASKPECQETGVTDSEQPSSDGKLQTIKNADSEEDMSASLVSKDSITSEDDIKISESGKIYSSYDDRYAVPSTSNIYLGPQLATHFPKYFQTKLPVELPKMTSTTDLFLDPNEGKWRMPDQMRNIDPVAYGQYKYDISEESERENEISEVVEPSYIILDNDFGNFIDQSKKRGNEVNGILRSDADAVMSLIMSVKSTITKALKLEVCRRLGETDLEESEATLVDNIEQLAGRVAENVVTNISQLPFSETNVSLGKFGNFEGEFMTKMIYIAVQDATHLRKVLPVGVAVGTILASLRKNKNAIQYEDETRKMSKPLTSYQQIRVEESISANETSCSDEEEISETSASVPRGNEETDEGVMVGAVTVALGASALLAHHQHNKVQSESVESSWLSSNRKEFNEEEHAKFEEANEEKNHNLISSLAEKAMSVAAPVVPTKGDGEVDHDRLVAVLAELGQKGGILRFVGKIALLWGGIRGAMSLTDKLISFLRISERPLLQRILAFSCMVLVLWSPVVLPFLPMLVQTWTSRSSAGIVGYACILGLYASITTMTMLWGKRIRGYDDPVEQYGLDLNSTSRVHEFLKGLAGGVVLVILMHSVNIMVGCALLSFPLSTLRDRPLVLLKVYGDGMLRALKALVTAAVIASVEELVFRSWLPQEIAVDHGYYRAILASAIAFSLIHWSLSSIPGYLSLSLALFGIKQRHEGKLAVPIGIRTGSMAANYIAHTSGLLKYKDNLPFWLVNSSQLHPFEGVVGLSISIILAIFFFPRKLRNDAS